MSIIRNGKKLMPTKLSNKKLMEECINCIKELNFTPYDINLKSSYYVFDYRGNSICQFRIKEIPNFIFAFWSINNFDNYLEQQERNGIGNTWADSLDINPKSEVVFFTQHEKDLDKFKPSRSGFVIGLSRDVWLEKNEKTGRDIKVQEWYTTELEEVLDFMKNNKYKARLFASSQVRNVWEWPYNDLQTFIMYIRHKHSVNKYDKKRKREHKHALTIGKKLVKRLKCYDAYLVDESDYVTPQYNLLIRLKDNVTNLKRKAKEDKLLYKYDDMLQLNIEECRIDYILNDINKLDIKDKEYYKRAEKRFIKLFESTKLNMLKPNKNDIWEFKILAQNFKDDEI